LFVGSEAAAATAVVCKKKSAKRAQIKNFNVDRPFEVYLVCLKKMNVLFAAKVVDPSL
jgi:serine protease inhibitor